MDKLFQEIQFLPGVGPSRSRQLARLNIYTIFDLLWHIPRAYINRNELSSLDSLRAGEKYHIKGTVVSAQVNRTRRGLGVFKAVLQERHAQVTAVWFNQPYLHKLIQPGQTVYLSGRAKQNGSHTEFLVEEYELLETDEDLRIMPIYPLTEGINQKRLRQLMVYTLSKYLPVYPEIFSTEQREKYRLCDIAYAFYNMHFPTSRNDYLLAKKRLAVEELMLFLMKLHMDKDGAEQKTGLSHKEKKTWLATVYERLPFQLTRAQQDALELIFADLEKPQPMNRMLQGDVGSGKTVIAALCMAKAAASGYQAVLMAPTEILARQHYQALSNFYRDTEIRMECLSGSTAGPQRKNILAGTASGDIHILVGTHALLQGDVEFQELGLVIIDEQHRFGVKQRAWLSTKGRPDFLMMTATPIPRTLALTVYGDLDLTVLDELPPGRQPVTTKLFPLKNRNKVYEYIYKKIKQDPSVQAFVVCPLIEESEKQDWLAAVALYDNLKKQYPSLAIDLLHGRLKAPEKKAVMDKFSAGLTKLLISTTVIEVGVDVPSAIIMVVEQAERFGLSQLHQLRGRVGRSSRKSYCFLLSDPPTEEAWQRLQAMERTNDGFVLAQEDLKIRGPGEFWGVKQHGLNQMKVANLLRHIQWIELAARILKEEQFDQLQLKEYVQHKFTDQEIEVMN